MKKRLLFTLAILIGVLGYIAIVVAYPIVFPCTFIGAIIFAALYVPVSNWLIWVKTGEWSEPKPSWTSMD